VSPPTSGDNWNLPGAWVGGLMDWAACESVQRGAESPHFRPGPLAPAEDAIYQWVTMIARGYLGKKVTTEAVSSPR
jgi:hypothetical protein